MENKTSYKVLETQSFSKDNYSIVPIRFEDRNEIMLWRNEQMYHLRQSEILTENNQNTYFKNIVSKLLVQEKPSQILFSYLKDNKCIGYGGLVHINWIDKNAEISFLMKTELEKQEFHFHWKTYLNLIEQVAFKELNLHKIFTYAFDLRPHLYDVLEKKNYNKEATLKEHCYFDGMFIDVIIHSKTNHIITIRKVTKKDEKLLFDWSNESVTRKNSYQITPIKYKNHKKWFIQQIKDKNACYFICEVNNIPASLVRFDKKEEKTTIGITIDKKFRGKKLASIFIKKTCQHYLKDKREIILASIKEENIASIKSFEKAGFKRLNKTEINQIPSYIYYYER